MTRKTVREYRLKDSASMILITGGFFLLAVPGAVAALTAFLP